MSSVEELLKKTDDEIAEEFKFEPQKKGAKDQSVLINFGDLLPIKNVAELRNDYTYINDVSRQYISIKQNTDYSQSMKGSVGKKKGVRYDDTRTPYDFKGAIEPAENWKEIFRIETKEFSEDKYKTDFSKRRINFDSDGEPTIFKAVGKVPILSNNLLSQTNVKLPATTCDFVEKGYEPDIREDKVVREVLKEKSKYSLRVFTTVKCFAAIAVVQNAACPFSLTIEKKENDIFIYPDFKYSPAVYETTLETVKVSHATRSDDNASFFKSEGLYQSSRCNAEFINFARTIGNPEVYSLPDGDSDIPYMYKRYVFNGIEYYIRCEIDVLLSKPSDDDDELNLALCRAFSYVNSPIHVEKWSNLRSSNAQMDIIKSNYNMYVRWLTISQVMGAESLFLGFVQSNSTSSARTHDSLLYIVDKKNIVNESHSLRLFESYAYINVGNVLSRLTDQESGIYHFILEPKSKQCQVYIESKEQNK